MFGRTDASDVIGIVVWGKEDQACIYDDEKRGKRERVQDTQGLPISWLAHDDSYTLSSVSRGQSDKECALWHEYEAAGEIALVALGELDCTEEGWVRR